MHARCYDPTNNRYYRYGARGITVCKRWWDFRNFVEDVEPTHKDGLTLDRIDTNGNYCPENFRWATYRTQARNREVGAVPEDTILAMQRLYSIGTLTQKAVGAHFGYSREMVKHYLRGLRA